ncbi:hypothetical protein [Frateuria sp. Soil773]|uniref:hypothetical protein n=1 Tax=Frateuria sp. Soil773 TaxID=1736407 RepID=UPI0012FACE2E|nr:hypothetical protein [Frateuria sp. Soil773]
MKSDKAVEAELEAALQRVLSGTPNSPRLVELAERGKLRLSYAVVAEEAGHSRTLIAFDGCHYQKFRNRVKALLENGPRATDLRRALEAAREHIRELQAQIVTKDSIQASLLLELDARTPTPTSTVGKVTRMRRR